MTTLWERLTGIGLQDPAELMPLDQFTTMMLLYGWGSITRGEVMLRLQLTPEQGEELDQLGSGGTNHIDVLIFVERMRYVFEGCRMGLAALDSVQNVKQALFLI
jgi:hypothetical protein